jgi:hypothetical protein
MTRLRQEYLARGKGLVFDILWAFVGITENFSLYFSTLTLRPFKSICRV